MMPWEFGTETPTSTSKSKSKLGAKLLWCAKTKQNTREVRREGGREESSRDRDICKNVEKKVARNWVSGKRV